MFTVLKPLSNNRGFSLLEVIIASAVFFIIVMGMSTQLVHQNQAISRMAARQDIEGLEREIGFMLSNPDTCIRNFGDLQLDTSQIEDPDYVKSVQEFYPSQDPNIPAFYKVGYRIDNIPSNFFVKSITLSNWRVGAANSYAADLMVKVEQSGMETSTPIVVKSVRFGTIATGTPNIVDVDSCSRSESGSAGGHGMSNCVTTEHTAPDRNALWVYCDPGKVVGASGISCLMENTAEGDGDWVENPIRFKGLDVLWPEIHRNRPASSGGLNGWVGDCYGPGIDNYARTRIWLTCCDP